MKGVIEGNQGHTYGLSFWLPYQGTGCYIYTIYALRSFYIPAFGTGGIGEGGIEMQKRGYHDIAARDGAETIPRANGQQHLGVALQIHFTFAVTAELMAAL